MSQRREHIVTLLQRANAPLGVDEIARRVGVHPNTARFHLDGLVESGSVERIGRVEQGDERSGRGRPRMGYQARPGLAKGGARRYRLLAEMLLSQLATGPEPTEAARQAGLAWGAHLVTRPNPGRTPDGAKEASDRLVAMLDELDFAPEPVTDWPGATAETPRQRATPDRIRLRHCPFLELAEPHRELVCTLHLALMQGALMELDAPFTVNELVPFAEPAACLAHLTRPQSL